jgi:hypothetical protein
MARLSESFTGNMVISDTSDWLVNLVNDTHLSVVPGQTILNQFGCAAR